MFHFLRQSLSKKSESIQVDVPVTIAVIGLGAMGQRNVEHLASSHNFQLIGVHDARWEVTKKIAQNIGAKPYENLDACLTDPGSEAIFVCTPHHLLADIGLKVLQSGKHLLLEKPMAIDTKSADQVITLGEERELLVSVNYSRVFTDAVRSARRLFELGAVGDLIGVETRWSGYKPTGYYYGAHSPAPDDWRLNKDKSGGGMVMMTTCHALHYIPYITGTKVKATAALVPPSLISTGIEDTLQGILKFEGGAVWAVLTSSSQRGMQVNDTTIWGSNGTIVLQLDQVQYYSTRVLDGKRPGVWHVEKKHTSEVYLDRWLDDTAHSIKQKKPLTVSTKSARDTLAVMESLYHSACSEFVSNVR